MRLQGDSHGVPDPVHQSPTKSPKSTTPIADSTQSTPDLNPPEADLQSHRSTVPIHLRKEEIKCVRGSAPSTVPAGEDLSVMLSLPSLQWQDAPAIQVQS
ncbi:hypothetical protein SEVIR_5G130301v4 [Setaria viridis]